MIEKIITQETLQPGRIRFVAEQFSMGYLAPSNGLLSYRITAITTEDGRTIDPSKLNGQFYNHYQRVMGQDMMGMVVMHGEGDIVVEGKLLVLKNQIWKREG